MICKNCKIEVENIDYHTKICMKKPLKTKPEKFVELPNCKNCGIAISQEKWDNAIKAHWLPVCEKCAPEIKLKFEAWSPLLAQLKLHR